MNSYLDNVIHSAQAASPRAKGGISLAAGYPSHMQVIIDDCLIDLRGTCWVAMERKSTGESYFFEDIHAGTLYQRIEPLLRNVLEEVYRWIALHGSTGQSSCLNPTSRKGTQ